MCTYPSRPETLVSKPNTSESLSTALAGRACLALSGDPSRLRGRHLDDANTSSRHHRESVLPALHHARDILTTTSTTATTIDDSNGRRRRRSATIDDDDDCGYTYYHDGGGYDDCVDDTHQASVITTYR